MKIFNNLLLSSKLLKLGFLILTLNSISCKFINIENEKNNINIKNKPEFSLNFEKQVDKIYREKEMQGDFIFAIVDEKGLVYSYALNNEILKGNPSSLNNNSPIYIASHTKSFTGTLAKILEEKGKIDLDKSISSYLPELNFNNSICTDQININELLNHTHGTFSTSLTWKTAFLGYSGKNSELINDLNTDFLYDPSGSFRYSNVGPIIAGLVIEKATGNTWKDEMKKHIFQPLNMSNTTTQISDLDFKRIRPSVTVSQKQGIIETEFDKRDITMHASGGVISTINDLSKWLSANIRRDSRLLNKEDSWNELHTSSTPQEKTYFTYDRNGYSLGWDVAVYQGDTILTRFGGLSGISFHISFIPGKKIGIIAFSTDNRAYVLPHLMANYAYNKLNKNPADRIFKNEKINFDKAFRRENEIVYPSKSQLLKNSVINNQITGIYRSTSNWPSIRINQQNDFYIFNWGILDGKINKTEEGTYTSNLGVLSRDFEIKNDTLITGSLIYLKE